MDDSEMYRQQLLQLYRKGATDALDSLIKACEVCNEQHCDASVSLMDLIRIVSEEKRYFSNILRKLTEV